MKTCSNPECKAVLEDDLVFCSQCGTKYMPPKVKETVERQRPPDIPPPAPMPMSMPMSMPKQQGNKLKVFFSLMLSLGGLALFNFGTDEASEGTILTGICLTLISVVIAFTIRRKWVKVLLAIISIVIAAGIIGLLSYIGILWIV